MTGQTRRRSGRPKGAFGPTGRLREQVQVAAPDIMEAMISRAKKGDPVTGQFLLSRVLPAARNAPLAAPADLPADHAEAARALLAKLAAGELLPDDAAVLLDGVRAAQVVTVTQAEERRKAMDAAALAAFCAAVIEAVEAVAPDSRGRIMERFQQLLSEKGA